MSEYIVESSSAYPSRFNISSFTSTTIIGEQYSCNMTFAALLITVSRILFLAAGLSVALDSMTLTPDILGYVSSLARENPFAKNGQPSYLDGLERAKAMRNHQVAIGDVNGGGDTGYIAFAATAAVHKLEKNRL